ncbi:hypothetical protein D3C71_2119000 [compost metagenome]
MPSVAAAGAVVSAGAAEAAESGVPEDAAPGEDVLPLLPQADNSTVPAITNDIAAFFFILMIDFLQGSLLVQHRSCG